MTRDEALALIRECIDNENLIKHMISVEAVMRGLAERLGADQELWGITGLLHDLDYPETEHDFARHGYLTCEMLKDRLPEDALHAILAHTGHIETESDFDKAIYCADPITGLIIAATLMHPSRTLEGLQTKSVKKRFKDKRFAAGADREQIMSCSELGLELSDFLDLSLQSMRKVSDQLGL